MRPGRRRNPQQPRAKFLQIRANRGIVAPQPRKDLRVRTMDTASPSDVFLFEQFRFDRRGGSLSRYTEDGGLMAISLGSRALAILGVMVERAGDLVSKDEIMSSVWPGTAVEDANLTVQISALRRVLDGGRHGGSCILNVPGRGYRFLPEVRRLADHAELPAGGGVSPDDGAARPLRGRRAPPGTVRLLSAVAALAILLSMAVAYGPRLFSRGASQPRLSLVVLPFENLSGDPKDDYLADGITDDLTSDLSNLPDAFVIARESAYTYKGKPADVRRIGEELGVRYVLEGSVRRIGTTLRVNVQLTSAETGAHLWSDRFDEQLSELAAGQEQIVTRMRSELGISLVEVEKARGLRERPTNPDAFDLILQARSLANQPPSLQRNDQVQALYESALKLDPSSVAAMLGIAYYLIDRRATTGTWGTLENAERAEALLAQARAIAPGSPALLSDTAYLLRVERRYQEAVVAAEESVRRYPNYAGGYSNLGQAKRDIGHPEEDIPLEEKAIRVSPRNPYLFSRYRVTGFDWLLLGRDGDAIAFLERSLAVSPEDDGQRPWTYRGLAAAYARTGRMAEAKHALAEADRLYPYYHTVRIFVPDPKYPLVVEQTARLQDGLRLAGERDHTEEEADFGVLADGVLHNQLAAPTPTTTPGVHAIRTRELAAFIAEAKPLVIDASFYMYGRSIPGAVGLEEVGLGGSFTDTAQDHLRRKMHKLTGGDLTRPIVAVGWNSESFRGRNLALRLAALGYTQVYWYRGGREAWEVAGLPETDLDVQPW
jgi:adenylate cyclase